MVWPFRGINGEFVAILSFRTGYCQPTFDFHVVYIFFCKRKHISRVFFKFQKFISKSMWKQFGKFFTLEYKRQTRISPRQEDLAILTFWRWKLATSILNGELYHLHSIGENLRSSRYGKSTHTAHIMHTCDKPSRLSDIKSNSKRFEFSRCACNLLVHCFLLTRVIDCYHSVDQLEFIVISSLFSLI